jgi:hypothetical protein
MRLPREAPGAEPGVRLAAGLDLSQRLPPLAAENLSCAMDASAKLKLQAGDSLAAIAG